MSLTPEQIAFETDLLDTQYKAAVAFDLEKLMTFYKDDATFTDHQGSQKGAPAMRAYFQSMWSLMDSFVYRVEKRTFDPAQNLIWESVGGTLILKGDPEKKEIKIGGLTMFRKSLGTGETKIDEAVRFSHFGDFQKRLRELGVTIGA